MKEIEGQNCYITTDSKNLYGIADKKGKVLAENSYLYIDHAFSKYFIAYKQEKGLGIIDREGNVVIDFEYSVLSRIEDKKLLKGVKMGRDNDITTIFSEKMDKVITLSGGQINIHNNYIEVFDTSKTTFIDNDGSIKTPKELFVNNKLFGIQKQNKWGFENNSGEIVVPCTYDLITEFNKSGFAGVKLNGKWGIIDEKRKCYK